MRRVLSFILWAVIGLVFIVLAIANRQPVDISFDPLPIMLPGIPLIAVFFAGILLGLVAAAIVTSLKRFGSHRRAVKAEKSAASLKGEVEALERELDEAETGKPESTKTGTAPAALIAQKTDQ